MRPLKSIHLWSLICFLGILTLVIVAICKENPLVVITIYSSGIYRFISQGLSNLFGLFPVSIWEFIYVGIIISPIYLLSKLVYIFLKRREIFKNKTIKYIKISVVVIVLAYFTFNMTWGLNYYKKPLITAMSYSIEEPKPEDLINLCNEIITKANDLRMELKEDNHGVFYLDNDFKTLSISAEEGFDILKIQNFKLQEKYSKAKPVMLSKFMSYTGITGMYSPFTGEANINIDIPEISLPATICHEMAHQRGIAREEEANYVAYLSCVNNSNKEFQYSGYHLALTYLMNNLYSVDKEAYKNLRENYSDGLNRDLEFSYNYWKDREGVVERLWNKFNDSYLKSNNQSEGVKSYGLVTRLLLAEYKSRE
ncbi:DUF3810 domain-containing protein [Clostridium sp.]|uniref:DUF3810 domain-containing protein n=1 Tax=Clostridium sp. TaxID=1506 RepID=UPI002FCB22B0